MSLIGDPDLWKLGAGLRSDILGPERLKEALDHEDDLDEFYHIHGHEGCYGQVWSRERLARSDRSLVIVSLICAQIPVATTLGVHVRGAIRNGLKREQLRQIIAMVSWYVGVPVGKTATEGMRAALAKLPEPEARVVARTLPPPSNVAELTKRGKEIRARVFGDEAPLAGGMSDADEAHQRFLDSHFYGVLWANEDLTPKQRCMVMLGLISGTRVLDEAEFWFRTALRLGHTREELDEVVLTVAAYGGELIYRKMRGALHAALAG